MGRYLTPIIQSDGSTNYSDIFLPLVGKTNRPYVMSLWEKMRHQQWQWSTQCLQLVDLFFLKLASNCPLVGDITYNSSFLSVFELNDYSWLQH